MKRTLLEVLAVMAVVVLLASFHHRISRIDTQNDDVTDLRSIVQDTMARVDDTRDLEQSQRTVLERLQNRLDALEAELADDSTKTEAASQLQQELQQARRDADRFKAEIARDVSRTKELVDAYHKEFRALDLKASENFAEAQGRIASLASRVAPDPKTLSEDLLAPTVQLNGDDTVGSGTLVFSGRSPVTKRNETYILTSYHVVRNIMADSPSTKRKGIAVTIYAPDGPVEERADMTCHDARIDAALLKLRSTRIYENLARTLTRENSSDVEVWQPIYAVGCPLGNDPIPTTGEISSVDNQLKGSNYWMINAPTYFGNSGGGIYRADTRELIGVFSKIYTHGRGNPVVVPHMGLCTPMNLIYEWLDREDSAFVIENRRSNLEGMLSAPPK